MSRNWKDNLRKIILQDFSEFQEDYLDSEKSKVAIENSLMSEGLEVLRNEDYAWAYCQENTQHEYTVETYDFWGSTFSQQEPIENSVDDDFFDVTINGIDYRVNKMTCKNVEAYYVTY